MLLPVDFDEDFIDVESVALTSVLSLQSAGINGPELYAPEANCFSGYSDASLGKDILDISMTQVEAILEPESLPHEVLWLRHN